MAKEADSSNLQSTLTMLDNLAAYKAHVNKEDEKRQVNIRLPSVELDFLDQLAEHYDESRTSMAQHLLASAIHDACAIAGIDSRVFRKDPKGELVEDDRTGVANRVG